MHAPEVFVTGQRAHVGLQSLAGFPLCALRWVSCCKTMWLWFLTMQAKLFTLQQQTLKVLLLKIVQIRDLFEKRFPMSWRNRWAIFLLPLRLIRTKWSISFSALLKSGAPAYNASLLPDGSKNLLLKNEGCILFCSKGFMRRWSDCWCTFKGVLLGFQMWVVSSTGQVEFDAEDLFLFVILSASYLKRFKRSLFMHAGAPSIIPQWTISPSSRYQPISSQMYLHIWRLVMVKVPSSSQTPALSWPSVKWCRRVLNCSSSSSPCLR